MPVALLQLHAVLLGDPLHVTRGIRHHQGVEAWVEMSLITEQQVLVPLYSYENSVNSEELKMSLDEMSPNDSDKADSFTFRSGLARSHPLDIETGPTKLY